MQLILFHYHTALIILVAVLTKEFSHALRDVSVRVPHAVRRGEQATLKCYYDIEDDSLYSVKWYKGRREFYRYTPKENPAMKIFQFPGVRVERFSSNESQLVLDAVTMATSGKYSCEVSADAPSFHTLIAAAELDVVETPHNAPLITGIRPRYRIGDILRGNCTSRHSKPAANLTWTVNNEEVNPSHVRHYKILRDSRNEMETSIIGIHFMVTPHYFDNGKLKLRCTAQMHDVYWKSTEKLIHDADLQSKHTAVAGTGNSHNMVQPDEPYDQYALHDGEMLRKKETYLTQLQDFLFHFVPSSSSADNSDEDSSSTAWAGSGATTHLLHAATFPRILTILLLGWTCKQFAVIVGNILSPRRRHHGDSSAANCCSKKNFATECNQCASSKLANAVAMPLPKCQGLVVGATTTASVWQLRLQT